MSQENHSVTMLGFDIGALFAVAGTMEHIFPSILGILGGIWYCIEIYDCPRMTRWRERRRSHKEAMNKMAEAAQVAVILVEKTAAEIAAKKVVADAVVTAAVLAGEPNGTGPGDQAPTGNGGSPAPGTVASPEPTARPV